MRNIKLTLEYDGTNYAGWQSQTNATAIQDVVAKAIEKMVEVPVTLRGASRTDAGVHALGQVAAFQTESQIPCESFLKGLNTFLPPDIRVLKCEEVDTSFHPIRKAKSKEYRYDLQVGEVASPLQRDRVWWVGPRLDVAAMEIASRCLVGEHDFKSFQGPMSASKTTLRTIDSIVFQSLVSGPWSLVRLSFLGTGFLKYMVRKIVGTLVAIGVGKKTPEEMQNILMARERQKAGPTAPPQGLYLVKIDY